MRVSQAKADVTLGTSGGSASGFMPAKESSPPPDQEIRRILGLDVPVSVVLAERDMAVHSILAITVGTIVEFNAKFDDDLVLFVGNRAVGRGQAVKVGENFGLCVTDVGGVHERIEAMRGP